MVSLVLPLTEYDEVCAISQERFQDLAAKNTLVATACGHKFEALSLNTWLAQRNSCPVCRGEVYEGDLLPVALAVAEVRARVGRAATAPPTLNGDLTEEEAISIAKETSKSELATKALFKRVHGAFTEEEAILLALKESTIHQ